MLLTAFRPGTSGVCIKALTHKFQIAVAEVSQHARNTHRLSQIRPIGTEGLMNDNYSSSNV